MGDVSGSVTQANISSWSDPIMSVRTVATVSALERRCEVSPRRSCRVNAAGSRVSPTGSGCIRSQAVADGVDVSIGGNRARRQQLLGAGVCGPLAGFALVMIPVGILNSDDQLAVGGVLGGAFFGGVAFRSVWPKLIVTARGILWRCPWHSARFLEWSEIERAEWIKERRSNGYVISAMVIRPDGSSEEVVRPSPMHPWRPADLGHF